MSRDRVSVSEAARRLGIKEESVRKRIGRGSLDSDRDESGHVWVYVDISERSEESSDTYQDSYQDTYIYELLAQLRSENAYLREENQRKDSIIMSLSQRLPEIEPASPESHTQASESAATDSQDVHPSDTQPQPTRGLVAAAFARLGRWLGRG